MASFTVFCKFFSEHDGNLGRADNTLDVIDEVELSLHHLLV
jgi:hypothetical protein